MLDLSKSIIRVIKRKIPFFQIDKTVFNDTRLSLQAKGLMMLIYVITDTWEFNETFFNLAKINRSGRNLFRDGRVGPIRLYYPDRF